MEWSQERIDEIYAKVLKLAATDEAFRAELLKDSSAAITKVAGEALPATFKVKIIENDPAYAATFVLPPLLSSELDDEDLENVAGGVVCGVDSCGAQAIGKQRN